MAANNYTSAEWQAMRAGPPYGAPLPQTGAPAPAPGLATRPNDWTTLRPPPQPHPQTTIGEMGGIMDLFDRLTDVVAQQRSYRVATNSYVLELEKLINKLRDCIDRLLALLQECRDNKEELERLRARIEQHPNLNLIRDQLTNTIAEMQNDQLNPDQFRAQLAELVGEIKRICDEVDNMRRAGFGDGGGGDDGDDNPGDDETKGNNDRRGNRGMGQKIQGDGSGRVRSMVADLERDDRDLPPNDPLRRTQAVSPEISRQGLYGNPIGDGGQTRRMRAARRERQLRQGSGERVGFGSGVSTGRGLGGGWQTPEKLESLSKSKPIRTLDSIKKKKKAKRGNKSKRRRKKSKRRRNKKKKQTKKKRNKKRKKKRTRKR